MHPQPGHAPARRLKNDADVELAVARYIDWFNHRRLHGEIGLIPPAEKEAAHYTELANEPTQEPPRDRAA